MIKRRRCVSNSAALSALALTPSDRQEVDFYDRLPGKPWVRTPDSVEISGLHHNVLGGFLDVRPAIYASGSGKATFRAATGPG